MNCCIIECLCSAKSICLKCGPGAIFCQDHGESHSSSKEHIVQHLDDETRKKITLLLIKSELKRCIRKIAEDSSKLIASINYACKKSIQTLKELNFNIQSLGEFTFREFDKKILTSIIESVNNLQKDICKVKSNLQKDFNLWDLKDKKIYCKKTWNLDYTISKEIFITNDKKYLFDCISYLGKTKDRL